MSLTILPELCIGCGACDFGCPTEAIQRPPIEQGNVFWIETYLCNDCGWCATACPEDCILPDPDTIVCGGRGCPIAAGAKGPAAGLDCTRLERRCPTCDDVLWADPDSGSWRCAHCDDHGQVGCPKTLSLRKGRAGQRPPRRSAAELYEHRAAGEIVAG